MVEFGAAREVGFVGEWLVGQRWYWWLVFVGKGHMLVSREVVRWLVVMVVLVVCVESVAVACQGCWKMLA